MTKLTVDYRLLRSDSHGREVLAIGKIGREAKSITHVERRLASGASLTVTATSQIAIRVLGSGAIAATIQTDGFPAVGTSLAINVSGFMFLPFGATVTLSNSIPNPTSVSYDGGVDVILVHD